MSNFWVRTIWGIVYAVTVICALVYGGIWGQLSLAFIISIFCMLEFLTLRNCNHTLDLVFGVALNLMVIMLNHYTPEMMGLVFTKSDFSQIIFTLILLFIMVYWGIALYKYGTQAIEKVTPVIFGLVYISLPCLLFLEISNNWKYPLLVFVLTWSSDTFAYLVGRLIGKRPLYEALSPKKTMEGFVGGILLTGVTGAIFAYYMNFLPIEGFMLGALVSVAGTAGDLFESAIKRQAGVKDSGRFLPGHGGALDRFDAFLFASVVVYSWFYLVHSSLVYVFWGSNIP
jgi:phosphatidate cytidylyltransferase